MSMLNADLLSQIIGCPKHVGQEWLIPLVRACALFNINTSARLSEFFPQLGHESGSLMTTSEIWGPTSAQTRYERNFNAPWPESLADYKANRAKYETNRLAYTLGNDAPGDGKRYKGHGPIQITGKGNHLRTTEALRAMLPHEAVPDFVANPEALLIPKWGALGAANYWSSRGLNALADQETEDAFIAITKAINGGTNGLEDRRIRRARAKQALESVVIDLQPEQSPQVAPQAAPAAPVPTPAPQPTQEPAMLPMMLLPSLASGLANVLIDAFSPLAKREVKRTLDKVTRDSAVTDQLVNGVVEVARQVTGIEDPVAAVVAAKADPAVIAQVEASTMDNLEKLAPLLEKLDAVTQAEWTRDEASRTAAHQRNMADPNGFEIDKLLTLALIRMAVGLLLVCALLIIVLAYFKLESPLQAVLTLFTAGAGVIWAKFGTRVDHKYGSSAGSLAKDAVNQTMLLNSKGIKQ